MPGLDSLVVRTRTKADTTEIVGWVEDPEALYNFSGSRLQWPLTAAQLRELERLEGLTAWVAVRPSGEVVGHFDLARVANEARLGRVIIKPSLRGMGLARAMASLILAQARALGFESVRLNVISANSPAVRSYLRAGFVVVPNASDRADVTVMVRQLE